PELIGLPLRGVFGAEDKSRLAFAAAVADSIVMGPGMGIARTIPRWLKFLCGFGKPCVIDADALNSFSFSKTKWWKWIESTSVLTPHPGEMRRLSASAGMRYDAEIPTSDDARIEWALWGAKTFGQILLLKGHRTIVTDGSRVYVNHTGDSTLAKGGSGDVLSGVIGSLIGQGMEPFDAACAGAWLHGRAGEIAGTRRGQRSALARDVIDALGEAFASAQGRAN
ncbi:MAG: NAD(P)H-hydrate dehydratase, partial [Tepidisphaeraceae bacterium]